jgi:hypothetical protein
MDHSSFEYITRYELRTVTYYISYDGVTVTSIGASDIPSVEPNDIKWFYTTRRRSFNTFIYIGVRYGDNIFITYSMAADSCELCFVNGSSSMMYTKLAKLIQDQYCDDEKFYIKLCRALTTFTLMLDDLASDIYSSVMSTSVKSANSTI